MALIENEEAARRLARVIISDIELYEKKKMQAGDDLTVQLAEGRALFRRRVVPDLAPIFEAVAEAKRSGASTGGPSVFTPSPIATRARPAPAAAPAAAEVAVEPSSLGETAVVPAVEPTDKVEARLDDARPTDVIDSETTARAPELAAEAAALRPPERPAARERAREGLQDDHVTPVPVEDIVVRRPGSREPTPSAWVARQPAAPEEPASPLQHERATIPVAFPAVGTMPEEAPIPPQPPAPAAASPLQVSVPTRAPAAALPTDAAPPPLPPSRAPTPQPIVTGREAPSIPPRPADKTPVPMSVSLAAASPASLRLPGAPSAISPGVALTTVPGDVPGALAVPSAAGEDIVNLRAKTSKVRVLLYIVATAGGLALIGRFLTRFL